MGSFVAVLDFFVKYARDISIYEPLSLLCTSYKGLFREHEKSVGLGSYSEMYLIFTDK